MDLAAARPLIQSAFDRLRSPGRPPVFDEWAILAVSSVQGGILAYHGPRAERFRRLVPEDAAPLLAAAADKPLAEGDLEFVEDAGDTRYDAFLKIGPRAFLILNHTVRTMAEIRADPGWLTAQGVLFELGERFRQDPFASS